MKDVVKRIIEIITANFPNGIRGDYIDATRVSRIYSAHYADENISRDFIINAIRENGIGDSGRFYFISDSDSRNILELINEILEACPIAYYSAVYGRHVDFFSRLHIFSPDVLKKFLQEIDDKNFCFDEFCSACRSTRLDYEVSKIFMATEKSLSLEELQERLPYVPSEKISAVLSNDKKYLPTNAGRFASLSKISFDKDEIQTAKQQIISAIDANDYAAPEDYDLSSNFALNPELYEKDLRNLIYEKFFSDDFIMRGKRLSRKGTTRKRSTTDPVNRLRLFLAEQENLSVEKLFAVAESFGIAQYVALYVAHEKMIRVDKNLFVKDSLINFDVAGVDEALTSFVQGKIIPLRAVTSFTGFPPVEGYTWNLFLLESFLRRFNNQYIYAVTAVNNANIGAIYPITMKFNDYLEVQAAVVVQENIPLEKTAVEEFLIGQGFRVRRVGKAIENIITRAQEISNH